MSKSGNNILVPVDFSEQSVISIEQTFNLARLTGATIVLLHVLKVTKSWLGMFSNGEQQLMRMKIKEKLNKLANEARSKSGLMVDTMLKDGKLLENILLSAKETKANFIVIGTHSSSNFKQRIIGHNASRLVKEAKCPVITIKGKHHRDGCKNIILPLDLTKETREKVSRALHFAKYFDARIHAVTVITTDNQSLIKKLNVQMQQVVKFVNQKGVNCLWNVIKVKNASDEIATKLIEYGKSKEGDLIIIMTQQEIDFTEYFIGSTATAIIESSDIPVMSINPTFKHNYNVII
jgi:nucleotide-binding universal stress UspA family protein